jgi:hypothetical protein
MEIAQKARQKGCSLDFGLGDKSRSFMSALGGIVKNAGDRLAARSLQWAGAPADY